MYDLAILGCGVSALALTQKLVNEGYSVVVIEQYDQPGGNHITRRIDGMEFDIGSIYFTENDKQFILFPELKRVCIFYDVKLEKVNWAGVISPYLLSIKYDILWMGPLFSIRVLASLMRSRFSLRETRTAADKIKYKLGSFFFVQSGLSNYMLRLIGWPADQIAPSFVDQRMRWVLNYSILSSLIGKVKALSGIKPAKRPNRTLFRPRGGFAKYYHILVDRLQHQGAKFEFGARLDKVRKREDDVGFEVVCAKQTYCAKRVISTLPIRQTCELTGVRQPVLSTTTLVTLMIAFKGKKSFAGDVLFNFHREGTWKRITVFSNIYGKVNGWEYFSVECPVTEFSTSDPATLFRSFTDHAGKLRFFDGDLQLKGSIRLENAYPVLSVGTEHERALALEELRRFGIENAGRQARFDYIPHSSLAVQLINEQFGSSTVSGKQS
jgi:phytoene dehydrogenase-like protein